MTSKLVLIHTVEPLLGVFRKLVGELLPTVQIEHILDEPMLTTIQHRGRLVAEDSDRLAEHVSAAERSGAFAVLVTCSTISPCVDGVVHRSSIPVLKIDEAMIARAVDLGPSVVVIATAESTLEPTRQMLEAMALKQGCELDVELVLVEGALPALLSEDGATHDSLVKDAVLDASTRADVVVLAQATMARVLESIAESERSVPILSSPHLALELISQLIRDQST